MGSESMTHVQATRTIAERTAIIRHHNDNARRFPRAGVMCVTSGIAALGKERLAAVLRAVREFDTFSHGSAEQRKRDRVRWSNAWRSYFSQHHKLKLQPSTVTLD